MPSSSPGPTPWSRRAAGLVLALLVPLAAGCRSDAAPSAAPERLTRGDAQVALSAQPVPTRVGIHRVHGRLPVARRKAVRTKVGEVVDAWWDASYLGGTYPRTRFASAFPGFTDAAESRAREDKALLTNQTGGSRIDSVTPRRRSVTLDILATGGRARTVTAHVVLAFDTTGDKVGTTTVRGRLFLTHKRGAWRIFGYDLSKGAR